MDTNSISNFCNKRSNFERFDDIDIINSYDPTECTFAVTSIKINKKEFDEKEIPLN